jgi:hypothetical protein
MPAEGWLANKIKEIHLQQQQSAPVVDEAKPLTIKEKKTVKPKRKKGKK